MDLNNLLAGVSRIPANLVSMITTASNYVPRSMDLMVMLKFVLIFMTASLAVGILSRIILGRQSDLNHTLSCSMGILLIYVITVFVYTFRPWNLEQFLSPLPFAAFWGEHLLILPFHGTSFSALCSHILSLVILSFLVNLMDTLLPQGERIVTWYILRGLTVVLSMLLHLAANWAINVYCPQLLVAYAPTALVVILAALLLISVAKVVLGIVLTIANPIIGAIYSFFFSNKIGKQLSKSVLSTILICGLFYLMEYFGYTVINISTSALIAYLPLLFSLFILWYLLGYEL